MTDEGLGYHLCTTLRNKECIIPRFSSVKRLYNTMLRVICNKNRNPSRLVGESQMSPITTIVIEKSSRNPHEIARLKPPILRKGKAMTVYQIHNEILE